MGFGVFFMAEYANIVVGCAMATVLFLGGWGNPFNVWNDVLLWNAFWFLAKMYFLIFTVVWVRWTFPRTQFYGLLNLSWKILIPTALVTLVITAVLLKFTGPSPKDAAVLDQPAPSLHSALETPSAPCRSLLAGDFRTGPRASSLLQPTAPTAA
jgi:hypothetical protein